MKKMAAFLPIVVLSGISLPAVSAEDNAHLRQSQLAVSAGIWFFKCPTVRVGWFPDNHLEVEAGA
jgi:hypothetical protein